MNHPDFFSEHSELTRRFFLRAGVLGLAAAQLAVNAVADESAQAAPKKHVKPDKGGVLPDPYRGGPVRVIVPEAYGFKSIRLSHVVLTNLAHANDTYAEQNNDVDSPLKTFAATITIPGEVKQSQFQDMLRLAFQGCRKSRCRWNRTKLSDRRMILTSRSCREVPLPDPEPTRLSRSAAGRTGAETSPRLAMVPTSVIHRGNQHRLPAASDLSVRHSVCERCLPVGTPLKNE